MIQRMQLIDSVAATKMWEEWEVPVQWDDETIKWLKSRPQVILDLMMKFPPDCKVKGTRSLDVPRPNEVGIVSSWFENGLISVVVPGRNVKAQCQVGWLEVVEYRQGFSPEDLKEKLK